MAMSLDVSAPDPGRLRHCPARPIPRRLYRKAYLPPGFRRMKPFKLSLKWISGCGFPGLLSAWVDPEIVLKI